MFDTILFDLDGTLTDSGLGITKAVQYALGQMGYEVPPRERLFTFIGPPLHKSFQRQYGMDEAFWKTRSTQASGNCSGI